MTPPVLTIVIPVWDYHTELLPRCLRAILQEKLPTEIIIVDNASRQPVLPPPDADVVTLPRRRTVGAARNAGLDRATAPFVVFADADDEVAPGSLHRGLSLLQSAPAGAGVLGRSIVETHGRHRRGRTPSRLFLRIARSTPRIAPLLWLAAFQASITTTVLRTSTVRAAGGFADSDLAEDWHLAARMARRGPFVAIDHPVRIYHRHSAAVRNSYARAGTPDAPRRHICQDCIQDPAASRVQRIVARAISYQGANRFVRWADPMR